jgi:hypothetical protein
VAHLADLLRTLASADVEFILVGGMAAAIHGSTRFNQVVDTVYGRSDRNLPRLVSALGSHHPYPRGAPAGLPFRFDRETLKAGLNSTLTTDLGWIDLLGEIPGGGHYEDLVSHTVSVEAFGVSCRVLDLETLIRTKRFAGRVKDFEAIAELQSLLERSQR